MHDKRTVTASTHSIPRGTVADPRAQLNVVSAYHEAGHAVMRWAFGDGQHIHSIDMGEDLFSAHVEVHIRPFFMQFEQMAQAESISSRDRAKILQRLAQKEMMCKLVGLAIEGRVAEPSGYASWLECELDWDAMGDTRSDFRYAIQAAKLMQGHNGEDADKLLYQTARWVDEALSHPRLWAVVESLAKQLLTVTPPMPGRRAFQVMNKAWGRKSRLPLLELGPEWKQRFPRSFFKVLAVEL